jgi:hypothetical protein
MLKMIEWNKVAKLLERQDGGSDLYFDFTELREGSLSSLVKSVVALPSADRARMVIDAGALGTLTVTEIVALSERDDFPIES